MDSNADITPSAEDQPAAKLTWGAAGNLTPHPRRFALWLVLSLLFIFPCAMLLPVAKKPLTRASAAAKNSTFQMDNEEGALLFQAMNIRKGETLYPDISQSPPWFVGTYTPLYMATVAALDDFSIVSFRTGRLITWASAIGVAVLILILVTGTTRNIVPGVLSAVLFLASYEVYRWIAYFRVDFLALFFSLSGLTVIALAPSRRWSIPLGTLLMVAALYTRQTMLAAPVGLLLTTLILQPRNAVKILLWLLAWGIPPFIALTLLTSGQFPRHVFYYNVNTFSANDLKIWITHTCKLHGWLVLSSAVGLGWLISYAAQRRKHRAGEPDPLPNHITAPPALFGYWQTIPVYAILTQWNILGAAKSGSAENYILEPLLGMTLLIGCAMGGAIRCLQYAMTGPREISKAAPIISTTMILAGLVLHANFLTNPTISNSLFSPRINPSATDVKGAQQVLNRVDKAQSPFTELAIFSLQSNKSPVLQPFIMSELARQNRWDESPFITALENAKYDLLVTQQELSPAKPTIEYTPRMTKAISEHYQLDQVIATPLWTYHLYMPRDTQ